MEKTKRQKHAQLKLDLTVNEKGEADAIAILAATLQGITKVIQDRSISEGTINIQEDDGSYLGKLEISFAPPQTLQIPRNKLN